MKMIMEVESNKRRNRIEFVEIDEKKISLFLDNFFYLDFENSLDRESFLRELNDRLQGKFDEKLSFIEISKYIVEMVNESSIDSFITGHICLNIDSYIIDKRIGALEIILFSNGLKIRIVLFKDMINKLKLLLFSNG